MNNARQVRQIRILGILLLGVVATALAVFVIGPRFTEPNAAQEQTIAATNEKAILDVRYIVLGQKAASLDSAKNELEQVSLKYLTNRNQFPELSSQIYEAAASVGIPSASVFEPAIDIIATAAAGGEVAATDTENTETENTATAPLGGSQAVPVSIKMSVEAPLPTIIQFLKALSNMKYIVVIEATQINRPEGTAEGSYTLNLTARAFMLPPVNLGGPVAVGPSDPNAPADPNATPAPTDPNATPAPTDPNATPAPTDPNATPAPTETPIVNP